MNRIAKAVVGLIAAGALAFGATGCGASDGYQEVKDRQKQANEASTKDTLEKKNLRAKIALEEDPNRIGYVYLTSYGKPFGYYVIKGKVSSSGSQLEPEDQVLHPYSGEYVPVDGPQDDGTYGDGDPGIFFFTADGAFVETSVDHFYSTKPVPVAFDIPKLG